MPGKETKIDFLKDKAQRAAHRGEMARLSKEIQAIHRDTDLGGVKHEKRMMDEFGKKTTLTGTSTKRTNKPRTETKRKSRVVKKANLAVANQKAKAKLGYKKKK